MLLKKHIALKLQKELRIQERNNVVHSSFPGCTTSQTGEAWGGALRIVTTRLPCSSHGIHCWLLPEAHTGLEGPFVSPTAVIVILHSDYLVDTWHPDEKCV